MKWSTVATAGIFLVSTGLFAYSAIVTNNNLDANGPEIVMSEERIEISIHDGDEVILSGITATDSRDGDVTDSLVVESISNFVDENTRIASIVAFDQDNHIARITREIVYTDYTSPRFSIEQPLRFRMESYDLMIGVSAEDCLDGNVTNKIHLTYDEEYKEGQEELKVTYSVANSEGDVATLPVTLTFYNPNDESAKPDIELTDYLIYVKAGTNVDPMEYLSYVGVYGKQFKKRDGKLVRTGTINTEEGPEYLTDPMLKIKNPVSSEPGTYEITYTVQDPRDPEDNTDDTSNTVRLIVVVTED